MECSIIVRVKNEVDNIKTLLHSLKQQTYQDFEVVVVDDGSTDDSDIVAYEYFPAERLQIITLQKPFSYAYASNVGAEAAKGKYLIYVSAHSIPISNTWLEDGLKHMTNEKVAGVYAMPLALPDTNIFEKLFQDIPTKLLHSFVKVCTKPELGILGATNAIFRKDLWEQYHFSEEYVIGGEDMDWARHFLLQGYVAIQDPAFRVYHSHRLGPIALIRQAFKYQRMMKPSRP